MFSDKRHLSNLEWVTILLGIKLVWCAAGCIAMGMSELVPSVLSPFLNAIRGYVLWATLAGMLAAGPIAHIAGSFLLRSYRLYQPLRGGFKFILAQTIGWVLCASGMLLFLIDVLSRAAPESIGRVCVTCQPVLLLLLTAVTLTGNSLLLSSLHLFEADQPPTTVLSTPLFTATPLSKGRAVLKPLFRLLGVGGLLTTAATLTPLTRDTYMSWAEESHGHYVLSLHLLAIALHTSSVLLAELNHKTAGALVLLSASAFWDTKIHVLTTLLRNTAFLNNTRAFALMDLSHAIALSILLVRAYKIRHPAVKLAVAVGLHHHAVGLIGTSFAYAPIRRTIIFLYPETIDARRKNASAARIEVPPFVGIARMILGLGRADLEPLIDEALFQSDVVSTCFSQAVLAASAVGLMAAGSSVSSRVAARVKAD